MLDDMTPLAKLFLLAGPLLGLAWVGLKVAGYFPGWSYWWAVLPPGLAALAAIGFFIAINIAMNGR